MTPSIFSFSFLPFLQARRDQRPSHSPVSFPTSLQFLRLLWCQRSLHVTLTGLTLCSPYSLFTGRSIQPFADTVVIRNHISQGSIAFVPTILMTLTDTSSTSDAAPINLQHSSDHRLFLQASRTLTTQRAQMLPNGKSRQAGHAAQQPRTHTRETREVMSPTTQQSIQLNSPFLANPNPRGHFPVRARLPTSSIRNTKQPLKFYKQHRKPITDRLLYRRIETNLSTISCEWWKSGLHAWAGRSRSAGLLWAILHVAMLCILHVLGSEPLRPPFSLSSVEIRNAPRLRDSK